MLYIEDLDICHYVGFLHIGSLIVSKKNLIWFIYVYCTYIRKQKLNVVPDLERNILKVV